MARAGGLDLAGLAGLAVRGRVTGGPARSRVDPGEDPSRTHRDGRRSTASAAGRAGRRSRLGVDVMATS
ncbi:hypothetical protein ISF6_4253 [Piscinibacter sakaiensis]|uniref:Uncharacterized protein n=1 Tax=Piscinibacter sakaiensis TaxID=1547922 RepID=A0A0K8P682_PISS1|nr:hypothetical protein ISF6_4253 [Piscinibacter sakaiensis]